MGKWTPLAKATLGLGMAGLAASAVFAAQAIAGSSDASVAETLAKRLPKTQVSGVDCSTVPGLCAVTAGANLFYTDRSARYLIVGRVYDMETRQDLTAAKLLELNPDLLVGAAAKGGATSGAKPALPGAAGAELASNVPVAALAKLPQSGAIQWGRGKTAVTVFSDFRCGYCKQLHDTLGAMKVRVTERPISILGTRSLSDAVICAEDQGKALRSAYDGEPLGKPASCDTSGLDANEAFARTHGFTGTPVIVRGDGAVVQGYRERAFLEAWLEGEGK